MSAVPPAMMQPGVSELDTEPPPRTSFTPVFPLFTDKTVCFVFAPEIRLCP
jgi:hypothetical protein